MLKKMFLLALPLMAIILSGCNRNTAARSEGRLESLAIATGAYSEAHEWHFPNMSTPATVKAALLPYVRKEDSEELGDIFVNPSTGRPYQPNTTLSNIDRMTIDNDSSIIWFYEDTPYDDGTRGAMTDVQYTIVPESDWPAFFATHTNPGQDSATPSNN